MNPVTVNVFTDEFQVQYFNRVSVTFFQSAIPADILDFATTTLENWEKATLIMNYEFIAVSVSCSLKMPIQKAVRLDVNFCCGLDLP